MVDVTAEQMKNLNRRTRYAKDLVKRSNSENWNCGRPIESPGPREAAESWFVHQIKGGTHGPIPVGYRKDRQSARQHMQRDPVTESDKADRIEVISVLNEALATELVCVLRYKRHYYMPKASMPNRLPRSFFSTPLKSRRMPLKLRRGLRNCRANQTSIGRTDVVQPFGIHQKQFSHRDDSRGSGGGTHRHRIYSEIIRWLDNDDPTTRDLMEEILKAEEEHADECRTFSRLWIH